MVEQNKANEQNQENKVGSHAEKIAKELGKKIREHGASTEGMETAAESGSSDAKYIEQINELNDKLLRSAAEAENVRRRAREDVDKAKNFAIANFAKELVEVLEHVYRASSLITDEQVASNETLKNFKAGIEMTKQEFVNVLEKFNVKRIYPEGELFDHNLHQALAQVDNKELPEGTVINVIQAGYVLNGRLLKPAMVTVAK